MTQLAKHTAQNAKQMGKLEDMMKKVLEGSTAKPTKAAAAGTGKQYWTCLACGEDRCFSSRTSCHKCGVARVPQPPGLSTAAAKVAATPAVAAAAPAAAGPAAASPMETEAVPIE